MKFVDANIFLELMLDDKKAEECKDFFNKIKNEKIEAITSDFIIYTCLLQIQYKLKSIEHMRKFLLFINELRIDIIRPSLKEIYDSFNIAKRYKLDFDDSLVVSLMLNNGIKNLVSFDTHFDEIPVIKREVL